MILFAILKWKGIILLSWWWLLLAIPLSFVPLAHTVCFIIFKMCGVFTIPVSWWWIIVAIVLDSIVAYQETSQRRY